MHILSKCIYYVIIYFLRSPLCPLTLSLFRVRALSAYSLSDLVLTVCCQLT